MRVAAHNALALTHSRKLFPDDDENEEEGLDDASEFEEPSHVPFVRQYQFDDPTMIKRSEEYYRLMNGERMCPPPRLLSPCA